MGRGRKQAEPDEVPGAPAWMVTFSDSMTLMLTFFVLLFSFSSFDEGVFQELSMTFAKALYAGDSPLKKDKGAFLPTKQIVATEGLGKGSEKPTLAKGGEDNLKEDTEPTDFRRWKVFLISSKKIFWGKGTAISSEGRNTLATMASFLREMPTRIVISENGPGDDEGSRRFGLSRAWTVMEYLTTKQGLDKRWFSISAASTIAQESVEKGERGLAGVEVERVLEVVLLERSIYN